ncbi:MAG: hypothetical protein Q8873_05235 [Bacillota bacterium]|nr:hypothetical protein [Bacillota bacterium]
MEFVKACPIWLEGLENEMNIQGGFKTKITAEKGKIYKIFLTASALYRLYINGEFICYGPARAAHGYARVDVVDITGKLLEGENVVAIEVAGYNCRSYYTIAQKNFLIAEITGDEEVVAATGYDFNGLRITEREQKCARYSFQRPFPDVWTMNRDDIRYLWKTEDVEFEQTQLADIDIKYLARSSVMPEFNVVDGAKYVENGALEICEEPEYVKMERSVKLRENANGDVIFDRFDLSEMPHNPLKEYYRTKKIKFENINDSDEIIIREGNYILIDMSRNHTGFVKTQIVANKSSSILIAMDEVLSGTEPDPMGKMGTNAIIGYYLHESINTYDLESFECYGFRYALVAVTAGEIILKNFSVREYVYPMDNVPEIKTDDEELNKIYKAAVETYRQNVIDIYMDCPTRERAGWLCDSYYTSQSEWFFTGKCNVEKDFVENFFLYTTRQGIPGGMLPMCYPSDHPDGNFIPQWAIWFVLELEQYLERNPLDKKEKYKDLCYNLIKFFKKYENADGFTEKLPKWNFIEWSKANQWVQDINYPTNMMYAKLLEITGNLYKDKVLIKKCTELRKKIIEKSFDGRLFIDNAVYNEEGIAVNTDNHSEVCQYYAFMFGLLDDVNDPKYAYIKDLILNVFGPFRQEKGEMLEIEPANALMGIYIRMELLYKWGYYEKLLEEIKQFFGKMADITGTLWENNAMEASLNHGFASFAGVMLAKSLEKLN